MKKFWVFVFILWPIIAVAACVMAPSQRWWFPGAAQSPIGKQIDDLFYMILIIVTIVFIGTEVALGYVLWRGARDTEGPGRALFTHGSHSLEVIWTIVPAGVLLFIALYQLDTWAAYRVKETYPMESRLSPIAEVTARQFEWRLRYPARNRKFKSLADVDAWLRKPEPGDLYAVNELHVPTGRTIVIHLRSGDVQHAFFVPNLRVKQDAVPGLVIPIMFEVLEPGPYEWVCAELCGWGHYKMKARVVAQPKDDYDAFLKQLEREQFDDGVSNQVAAKARRPSEDLNVSTLNPVVGAVGHAPAHAAHHEIGFVRKYIFSTDHKVIGIQFLITTLIMLMVGGALALAVRWQLAFPWASMPILGKLVFADQGGQISPEFYTMLFTMHASVMIFLVIIPILAGAFGNYCIPLMIGADDMAFPLLNMLSYWFMWPAIFFFMASFFVHGGGPSAGWTVYPVLSDLKQAAPGSGTAQTFWLIALTFIGVSSMMGSVNYMTTIINMRAPGMTLFRMPMTIWAMFITAILQAFALPVLTAAGFMQLADREFGTCFFIPSGLIVNNSPATVGGGQPLLWQHLFWFYSHPAVYIMLLPAMGMVSDMLATMCRKPLFGYKPMVYSIAAIAGLGFIVWGHHMFTSGMNPALGMTFMISTMMIALPSAIKTFNWIGTVWGGGPIFNTVFLNCIGFLSMFIVGGLSGIFMAAVPVDIYFHDTYFIVAHFHYILFGSTLFAVFGGITYWFPKMFGRMMNEKVGKLHFLLTFIGFNGTFFPMHLLGIAGMPRRYADPYLHPYLEHLLPMNQFMTCSAILMGFAQFLLLGNFAYSIFFGPKCGRNPWQSNTLEWSAPTPPPHGNFDVPPIVYRGPYEYSSPSHPESDFWPQTEPPKRDETGPAPDISHGPSDHTPY